MIEREMNKKVYAVFVVCGVVVTTVNWVLQEKFIADARIAYFVNICAVLVIALLFTKYLESKMNRSVDALIQKINSLATGDLTQRFKEDPQDILPYGLSFALDEMVKFFRARIGGLWKMSATLIKQLNHFVTAARDIVREFQTEVEYLVSIGDNLETVRSGTMDMHKRYAELQVNTRSDLIAVEQINGANAKTVDTVKRYKSLVRGVASDIQELRVLADNIESTLNGFRQVSRTMMDIHKEMNSMATESSLVKLNASIDAANKQVSEENYIKLIGEVHKVIDKMGTIARESNAVTTFTEDKIDDMAARLRTTRTTLGAGLDSAGKIEKFLADVYEQTLAAAARYTAIFDKINTLNTLMKETGELRGRFAGDVKSSIDHFDKLKADTQITLLHFNAVEDKITGIEKKLKELEEFKNAFQIG